MVAIIVILLAAMIVVPLCDEALTESVRKVVKIVIYLVVFIYVVWLMFGPGVKL